MQTVAKVHLSAISSPTGSFVGAATRRPVCTIYVSTFRRWTRWRMSTMMLRVARHRKSLQSPPPSAHPPHPPGLPHRTHRKFPIKDEESRGIAARECIGAAFEMASRPTLLMITKSLCPIHPTSLNLSATLRAVRATFIAPLPLLLTSQVHSYSCRQPLRPMA